ncbi:putative kinase/phosphatase [Pseudooceanicola batsensis HTCC2597]|uniref:Putative kinase/phosphatase n=1 Tax=Pseudooceanicola batsensis (strain ATCC BAA-863 / DSM 15984 / KCTC 12145 / HTCC2597) TaxID=252305 RepID=A3TVF3_PSEBH|nr:HPr kinase/phosphatase C-terminal domain-containing protein [Pseudooceanicola batsensis]EAQ04499.1 putative kinase/phosphatase [Pseudooceanicola batsensis HTCC2597]
MTEAPRSTVLHASAVALEGRAVLIEGPSGSGKSSLALALMAMGAQLVADDRVGLVRVGQEIRAEAPPTIAGRIEARGVGILAAAHVGNIPVALMVDLSEMETDRLPPRRSKYLLGISLPLLHNSGSAHFAAAILQYLRGGREA